MVMADVLINEVLTFYSNYFDSTPKCNILNVVVGFFSTDEVANAKKLLFDKLSSAEQLKDVRHVHRRMSDNKRKLDADDIYDLLVAADHAKVELPCFVAKNLKRVPSINPNEADVCTLAANMRHLTVEVEALSALKATMNIVVAKLETLESAKPNLTGVHDHSASAPTTVEQSSSTAPQIEEAVETVPGRAWSAVVESLRSDYDLVDGFSPVVRRRPKIHAPPVSSNSNQTVRCGKRTMDVSSRIKTAPRQLAAFVSRLHKDTTAEDLQTYLSDAGFSNPHCYKLEAKNGKHYSTAAFKVMCDASCHDVFYDESSWPEGVELRDWVFRNKNV